MSWPEEEIAEMEVKLAYADKRIDDLDATVVEQSRRLAELEEEVRVLRGALRRLAHNAGAGGDVLGAYDADDPVPRSG